MTKLPATTDSQGGTRSSRRRGITRRTASIGAAAAAGLLATRAPAIAQEFPNRAITIVCPFGPGTAIDIIARLLAQDMTATLGQSVIVDNRAGATGNIGADYVAKSRPDGHTAGDRLPEQHPQPGHRQRHQPICY